MEGNCIQSMPVGRNWKNKVNRRRPSPLHVPIWVKLLWKSSGGAVLDFSSSPPRARPLLNKTPTHNIRRMEARNINVWTVLWIWTCLQMWRGRISTRWTVWLILISRHKMEWKKNGTFSIHQNDVKVFLFFFHSVQQLFVDWAESVIGFVRMWDAQSDKDFGVGRLGTLTTRIVGSLALVKDHQEVRVLTSGPLLGRQLLVVLGRRSWIETGVRRPRRFDGFDDGFGVGAGQRPGRWSGRRRRRRGWRWRRVERAAGQLRVAPISRFGRVRDPFTSQRLRRSNRFGDGRSRRAIRHRRPHYFRVLWVRIAVVAFHFRVLSVRQGRQRGQGGGAHHRRRELLAARPTAGQGTRPALERLAAELVDWRVERQQLAEQRVVLVHQRHLCEIEHERQLEMQILLMNPLKFTAQCDATWRKQISGQFHLETNGLALESSMWVIQRIGIATTGPKKEKKVVCSNKLLIIPAVHAELRHFDWLPLESKSFLEFGCGRSA